MTRMPLSLAMAMEFRAVSDWWDEVNESTQWQDGIFYTLCAAYALVSSVALVQLIRIELRVPEYGWTTQKVFHLMNFIVNGVRAIVFGFHKQVFVLHPKVLTLVLLDLPGLLFFTTYTLLVLFWAEIYHQARSLPTDKLRIFYISINVVIYVIQVCIWIYLWINDNSVVEFVGKIFIAVVSFLAALGFLLYGGRLFFMLRRFPIESKGRRKKLHEVGSVTAICFTCFLIRCFVVVLSAFDANASLDVLDHPILNLIYYTVLFFNPFFSVKLSLFFAFFIVLLEIEITYSIYNSWLRSYRQPLSSSSCANCRRREYQLNITQFNRQVRHLFSMLLLTGVG